MEFTIKLTDKQLDIIGIALGQRPYAEVVELFAELNRQVKEQAAPPTLDTPP